MFTSRLARIIVAVVTLAVSVVPVAASAAEGTKLHALVIGNGAYPIGELTNPANDAQSISTALTSLGFDVTTLTDVGQQQMEASVHEFSRKISDGGLAFFFFAGHGVQVNGENYLIPVDAVIPDEFAVKYKTVSLGMVLDALGGSRSNLNVVVLDCCRNNPFQRTWTRGVSNAGLAATTTIPEGTLIAYATSPGKTASDGKGINSPYTQELAAALTERPATGLLLREVFFKASKAVKDKTGQSPWLNMEASLENFYLRQPETSGLVSSKVEQPSIQEVIKEKAAELTVPQGHRYKSLFDLANQYLLQGQYDNAISAFAAILEDPHLADDIRQKARKGRGAAYLGRGTRQDLEQAIIDYTAAGLPGITLTVHVDEADLKVEKANSGTVRRGQVLQITRSNGEWFWVAAVNGIEAKQGWIKVDAIIPSNTKPTATPSTTTAVATTGDIGPRPSDLQNSGKPLSNMAQPVPLASNQSSTPYQNQPTISRSSSQSGYYDSSGISIPIAITK